MAVKVSKILQFLDLCVFVTQDLSKKKQLIYIKALYIRFSGIQNRDVFGTQHFFCALGHNAFRKLYQ